MTIKVFILTSDCKIMWHHELIEHYLINPIYETGSSSVFFIATSKLFFAICGSDMIDLQALWTNLIFVIVHLEVGSYAVF
jgi:hypothetical protein